MVTWIRVVVINLISRLISDIVKIEAASFINMKSVAWEQNTEVSVAAEILVCWTGRIKLLFTKMGKTEQGKGLGQKLRSLNISSYHAD